MGSSLPSVFLWVAAAEYYGSAGDAIRFRADRVHRYHNSRLSLTKVNMVIHYG